MVARKRIACFAMVAIAAGVVLAWSPTAMAAGDARMEAIERRLAEQDKRIAEQDKTIKELKKQLNDSEIAPTRREEIEKVLREIEADNPTAKLGDWLEDFGLSGDLRLRVRARRMSRGHTKGQSKWLVREEFRLRVGGKKTWWDKQMEAGFRLESGSSNSATSANDSYGGNASDKNIWIGRAYAKYKPNTVKGLTVIGGKMANPLVKTDLIWDSDINPEGVFVLYKPAGEGQVQPFFGAGFFEMTNAGPLYAYQGGADVKIAEGVDATAAVAWYDWRHYEQTYTSAGGNPVSAGPTPPATQLTAQEFDIINAIFKVNFAAAGLPMSAFADYARNCEDQVGQADEGYALGLKVGKIGKKQKTGEWFVRYRYAQIEANAFPSGLSDGDFMGTDRKGHEVGAAYAISEFLKAEFEVVCNEPDNDLDGATSTRTRRLQFLFDLIWSW